MANVLIIPGVSVSVVKDVVPQQLAPSGILGIVGFTGATDAGTQRAASWSELRGLYGEIIALSLPEARQALDNGVSELVVVSLKDTDDHSNKAQADLQIDDQTSVTVFARASGTWANDLDIELVSRTTASATVMDIAVKSRKSGEILEQVRDINPDNFNDEVKEMALVKFGTTDSAPKTGKYELGGGKDASAEDYNDALSQLDDEPDVDLVLAAVQDFTNVATVAEIYGHVINHCNRLSGDAKGRLGLGQIGPSWVTAKTDDVAEVKAVEAVSSLVSDRFVMVAPHGAVGAVTGMIGNLDYFISPTFKTIGGTGALQRLKTTDQTTLLGANIAPVSTERGRGTIVVRGLTTDGDQISVRRVADRSVRTLKMVGDLFIGRLNNSDGRGALKQKLIEALMQMERDGALVPSTDGKDPAFKVDVYSSQADFALGIVRVDMAVRPIRAIDYIYATVLVQV